jgi:hypothetical protein
MPAKRKKLPLPDDVQDMLDELMPVPALTDEDVDPLQLLIDAPAEEFQRAMSPALRKLMITGLRNVPAPKNLKELASVYAMYEKIEGLNKPADKAAAPMGMVIPLRAVQRRIGALPEPPQPAPTLLELEAEMADEAPPTPPPTSPAPPAPPRDDFEV